MAEPSQASERPLLVSGDDALVDELLRLAGAAEVLVTVVADAGAARPWWPAAPLVLVGDDQTEALARACLPPRGRVVVVGRDISDAGVWLRAASAGASHVDFLPEGEDWLAEQLQDSVRPRLGTLVVGVVGGRGGAGATTLAAALSFAGLRQGLLTLLVDADPLGGGMDLLLGPQLARGLRWADLVDDEAALAPAELFGPSFPGRCGPPPELDGLTVLSWDPGDLMDIPPETMHSVLAAAAWGAELVVVDLPRRRDQAADVVLTRAHRTFLVVPAEARAIASAARVAGAVGPVSADLQIVVRGPAPTGLDPEVVAACIGRPLGGATRAEPGLAAALDRGDAPGRRPGPLSELADQLLGDLIRSRSQTPP